MIGPISLDDLELLREIADRPIVLTDRGTLPAGGPHPKQVARYGLFDLAPNTRRSVEKLARAYFPYREWLAFGDSRWTPWNGYYVAVVPWTLVDPGPTPTPTPTPTPSPTPTPQPTPEATPAPTLEATPATTAEATPEPTLEPVPEATAEATPD